MGGAIPFLRRSLAVDPNNVWSHCKLSQCLYQLDRYDESLEESAAALRLRPDYEWAHRLQAYALKGKGDFRGTAEALREAARCRPDSVFPWQAFSLLVERPEYHDEVLVAARRAVELGPEDPIAWFSLGRALWPSFEDAANAYRKCLSLNPEHAHAHNNLGWALLNLGRLDEAEPYFERSSALEPRWPHVGYAQGNLAILRRLRGDLAGSDERFAQLRADSYEYRRKAVEQRPDDATAHHRFVTTFARHKGREQAWEELRAGLRRFPSSKAHWQTLANWAAGFGRYRLAFYAARRALALDDRSTNTLAALAKMQSLAGRAAEARRTAERIAELAPGDAGTEQALGDACLAAQDWAAALEHFERASAIEPLDCCYMVRVGIAKTRLGDRDGAEAAWSRREHREPLDCDCAMIRVLADLLGKELPG